VTPATDEPPRSPRGFETPIKTHGGDAEDTRRVVRDWLAERLGAADLELSAITTPTGTGVANETVLVDATWSDGGARRSAGFVVRLASAEPFYPDADIRVGYRMYEALAHVPGVPVPRLYGFEPDMSLLGTPFFVMEKVEGEVPADEPHYTATGFVADATPDERRRLWVDAVEVMAGLHQVDSDRVAFLRDAPGMGGLAENLAWYRAFLDRVEKGTPHEVLRAGHQWLAANLPTHIPPGLSWGDARVSNMIFRDHRCVAVLDWDQVSLAGPEADLAWWILMEHPPARVLPGIGTPDDLLDLWEDRTRRKVTDLHWHVAFTAFRLGVIVLRLFDLMAAAGRMPPDVAVKRSHNSGPAQQLALLLGLTPPGEVRATLPDLKRL